MKFLIPLLIPLALMAQTNLLPPVPGLSTNLIAKSSGFIQQVPRGFTFTDDFLHNEYIIESSTDLVNWVMVTNFVYQPASVTLKNNGGNLFVRGYWLLTPTNTVNTNIYHP